MGLYSYGQIWHRIKMGRPVGRAAQSFVKDAAFEVLVNNIAIPSQFFLNIGKTIVQFFHRLPSRAYCNSALAAPSPPKNRQPATSSAYINRSRVGGAKCPVCRLASCRVDKPKIDITTDTLQFQTAVVTILGTIVAAAVISPVSYGNVGVCGLNNLLCLVFLARINAECSEANN